MIQTGSENKKKIQFLWKEIYINQRVFGIFLFAQIYVSIISWIFSYYYFGYGPCGYSSVETIIAPIVFGLAHLFNYGYAIIMKENLGINTKKAIIIASITLILSASIFLGGIIVIPMC